MPLGEREAFAEHARLQPRARADGRHRVGGARREQRALPALTARPAADAGAADAGARRDLAVAERGLLDEAAHLAHGRVLVRPARAARVGRDEVAGPVRLDLKSHDRGTVKAAKAHG